MLLNDILEPHPTNILQDIKQLCSDYIIESNYNPIYKLLPVKYNDVHRVKVRAQNKEGIVATVYNKAFENETFNISGRAIITECDKPSSCTDLNLEPFYIFPLNEYKFLYSKEVKDSSKNTQTTINTIFEQFPTDDGIDLMVDILKYTYVNTNLLEGIISKSEIIFYNIPAYYAVRCSKYEKYQQLFK